MRWNPKALLRAWFGGGNALNTKGLGDEGQALAERFLEAKGYRVVARNYRTRRGEIDFIARQGRTLVFVEVKRRKSAGHGAPVQQVSPGQRRRFLMAAQLYMAQHPPGKEGIHEIRCDIIGVLAAEGAAPQIQWVSNAFGSEGPNRY